MTVQNGGFGTGDLTDWSVTNSNNMDNIVYSVEANYGIIIDFDNTDALYAFSLGPLTIPTETSNPYMNSPSLVFMLTL